MGQGNGDTSLSLEAINPPGDLPGTHMVLKRAEYEEMQSRSKSQMRFSTAHLLTLVGILITVLVGVWKFSAAHQANTSAIGTLNDDSKELKTKVESHSLKITELIVVVKEIRDDVKKKATN